MIQKLAALFGLSVEGTKIVLPILVINVFLVIIAIIDLIKNWRKRTVPVIWLFVIIVITLIGPVAYFIIGRSQKSGKK